MSLHSSDARKSGHFSSWRYTGWPPVTNQMFCSSNSFHKFFLVRCFPGMSNIDCSRCPWTNGCVGPVLVGLPRPAGSWCAVRSYPPVLCPGFVFYTCAPNSVQLISYVCALEGSFRTSMFNSTVDKKVPCYIHNQSVCVLSCPAKPPCHALPRS